MTWGTWLSWCLLGLLLGAGLGAMAIVAWRRMHRSGAKPGAAQDDLPMIIINGRFNPTP